MELYLKNSNKILYKNILKYFIILSLATSVICYEVYLIGFKYTKDLIIHNQKIHCEIVKNTINNEFENIIGDLKYLYANKQLQNYMNYGNESELDSFINQLYTFSNSKKIYNQIRILDVDGNEVVKVVYEDSLPQVIPKEDLQNKKDRYYFKETMKLEKGELYISQLDLNRENGKLELPYKPTIRFSTPLYDHMGNKRGTLIINYFGKYLIDKIHVRYNRNIYKFLTPELMLLNNDGYWLMGNNTSNNWTFLVKGKEHISFKSTYPHPWNAIIQNKSGVYKDKNGIFTFDTVSPTYGYYKLNNRCNFSNEYNPIVYNSNYSWILVSYLDSYSVSQIREFVLNTLGRWSGLIIVLIFVLSVVLAYIDFNNKLCKNQLKRDAHTDILTGLYNRRAGLDLLEKHISNLDETNKDLSIAYIDLNNLKIVNDIYGHKEGDFLICKICTIIKESIRSTDTFCRLGGDEFLIILTNCNESQAKEIITKVKIKLSQYTRRATKDYAFSISAGICQYDSRIFSTLDHFLEEADRRMYLDKKNYKKII
ncbi:MAG: sensor domain-containing diguanylate cyclase [Anaeromicrobium sp.]|jgi:diguanylate cyclase (GGDEF)-like protein|uniref:sensor domain-containing diguanylate cyclase n=1 Tax=Anaeromicrobium sp. TaxID=1929132 RepID=UPI0025F1B310|nr:sensor domain-containing diguanylate cyclase [Anaeromicrobium sp.]MCT4595909.1 sensor domain-containing diguanylate cyclase [Anaeromicrobium sp.]